MNSARLRAAETPLDLLDVSHWDLFQHDTIGPYFERLRKEDPIHLCATGPNGPYWSITRYEDVRRIEIDHETWSSRGNVTIVDQPGDFQAPMFIAMDPPIHDAQRRVVQPAVAPRNLRHLEPTIRERAARILDALPIGETFDWVEAVSVELTTQMLATLFDFPFEERHKLTRWSDVATAVRSAGIVESEEQRRRELRECLAAFDSLWEQKRAAPPANDLISMLAHAPETADMRERPMELLGNMILLIVGGNDTTRNSISGGVLALHEHPEQFEKLRENHSLVPNMVSEIIRWQTPLAHMRRTATRDTEFGGKSIRAGDKVVLWYVSANRDEQVFPDGDALIIDRPNAGQHLSYGFGVHRCMGAHLADLQLRVLWEEILERFDDIEVVGPPERIRSNFVRGYSRLPVRLSRKRAIVP
jgi:cytochrome P450